MVASPIGSRYFDQSEDPWVVVVGERISRPDDVRLYDGEIPYDVEVLDEIVHVWLCEDGGQLRGILRSENPVVRD